MLGPWLRLSTSYWRDPKLDGLGPMAEALYIRLLAYTVEHETDGALPRSGIKQCSKGIRNAPLVLDLLITQGLINVASSADSNAHDVLLTFPSGPWNRWQRSKADVAGQGASSRAHGRTGAGAGAQAPTHTHVDQTRPDQIFDAQAHETPKPLAAVIDGVVHRINGNGQWQADQGAAD